MGSAKSRARPALIRVLIVDDNAENRALAKATLEDEGISAILAATGEEGIAAFVAHQPECILLDIRMPGLDGIAVCERIRAMPDGARVAILFVTAQRDVATFDRALAAGGDDFITKPFRPAELTVRIETSLRIRRIAAERGELSLQLKCQRDELQRLHLHKEQLAAFVVHDLKNPVNTIDLHAQRTLRNPNADARSRDAATKIHEEARGLMQMITNLLDIGRADEGQLAPAPELVDGSALIQEAVEELRECASTAGVELTIHVEASEMRADRALLHRVLINLIENAIRHAPVGSAIDVGARPAAGSIELRVVDRGPGIPEASRATVFDRFASSGGDAHRGLGLAFCKVAVEAHGGQIWIEDGAPGAAFLVRIPRAP